MEILEHGNRSVKTTCKKCNCVFRFVFREIVNYYKPGDGFKHIIDYDYIECPECGEKIILTDRSIGL